MTFPSDISEIIPDLYISGGGSWFDVDKHEAWIMDVLDHGIKKVVDLMAENDFEKTSQEWFEADNRIQYRHIPDTDTVNHHMREKTFFDAWSAWRGRYRGDKVLFHCYMGVNRAPSVVFFILLCSGWTPEDAWDKIRKARPIAGIWYAEQALRLFYRYQHDISGANSRNFLPDNDHVHINRRVNQFLAYRDKVFPPEEQAKVAHIIGQRHKEDQDAADR